VEIDGVPLRAAAYVVATGAVPDVPALPGLDQVQYLTSTTAMELTAVPQSLVVIGGGYVGMEQAQLFAHLGAEVTVVGRVAPHAEPELVEELRGMFEDGITVVEERAATVSGTGDGTTVTTTSGRRVSGQRLLVATGRRA
jgi:mercuric reductase